MQLFRGHSGAHGTHGVPVREPGGSKWAIKSTAKSVREPVTLELWEMHLSGTRPLGIVPITEDSTCWWGSIDVDDYDVSLTDIIQKVEAQKLPLVPCRSKSGGLHLFLFLREAVPAGSVQAVLRDLSAQLGLAGCEVFPKQTRILSDKGDVGSWMVMPYYGDTYGGKIKEQVGLKRTGAEMTLGEFLSLSELRSQTEEGLHVLGQRRAAQQPRSKAKRPASGAASPCDFSDGPPCLQQLGAQGVVRGGQSNALFMMGVYYKKADPENWKARLEWANQNLLTPPGSSDGLTSVMRSLEKKDYEYTCKAEPMVSHCNSMLCRTRRHGVGDGGNVPVINSISMLDTEPPIWFVDVEAERIEASTEQLQNYTLFHRLCLERVHRCYGMIRPGDWMGIVSVAMEGLTVIEAPGDVGVAGQFHELLEEFLTNRARGERKEDLLSHRPWEDEEEGRHYFRLSDLQKFLRQQDFRMERGQITQRIRKLGGMSKGHRVKDKYVACWWVPSDAFTPTPPLDVPAVKRSPI